MTFREQCAIAAMTTILEGGTNRPASGDEIARVLGEHCVRQLGHVGAHQIHAAVAHEACRNALAEVARLREALTRIADDGATDSADEYEYIERMRDIARAALGRTTP